MVAVYNSMALWDEGIRAAQEATRLQPEFELAKNNVLYAIAQKQHAGTGDVQVPAPKPE
jgi:hypothetical protein